VLARASFREMADRERLRLGKVRILGESDDEPRDCGHRTASEVSWKFWETSKVLLVLNVVTNSSLLLEEVTTGLVGGVGWYGSGGKGPPPRYGRVGSCDVESPVKVRRPRVLAVLLRSTERGANGSSGSGQG